jgi:A/G-specific adenine glycosylase
VVQRADGALLLERRPDRGLLGGMLGWPGSDWVEDTPTPAPPLDAAWHPLPTEARHTFTHFHLILHIHMTTAPTDATPQSGDFIPLTAFKPAELPTVMRKVFDLAHGSLAHRG